jgi:hypothetical protein
MSPELIRKPLHYDRQMRRLWIRGQRCHHGATGALLATMGATAVAAGLLASMGAIPIAAGGVLMAHDWKDRAVWFARGWQDQA